MDNALLTNREFIVEGNWYSPRRRLLEYKSVKFVKFAEQSSSAGDWSGFIIQSMRGNYYIIPFSQENNFPKSSGFTVFTGDLWKRIKSDGELNMNELMKEYINEFL